jgi:hypothetical protein
MTTADDYDVLFRGLTFFTLKLQYAAYQPNDEAKVTAIQAAAQFAQLFKYPDDLALPFLRISDALRHGVPVVKQARRRGNPELLDEYAILHGYAAATVDRLVSTGWMDVKAREAVAGKLRGVRTQRGGLITPRTVRCWREEVLADVGRYGVAAWVCHDILTGPESRKFSNLKTAAEKRTYALNSLAGYVRKHFKKAS